jgi:hypothetical protein
MSWADNLDDRYQDYYDALDLAEYERFLAEEAEIAADPAFTFMTEAF